MDPIDVLKAGIVNTASVTSPDARYKNGTTPNTTLDGVNDGDSDQFDSVPTRLNVAKLKLKKLIDGNSVIWNEGRTTASITYTIQVSNDGPDPARQTVAVDTLQIGAMNVGTNSDQAVYNPATRTVTWNAGTLAAGEQKELKISAVYPALTMQQGLVNAASVTSPDSRYKGGGRNVTLTSGRIRISGTR